ncbi:membrane or secreted protein [Flagellimonas alvinocaridis]|uniref:Membrane or secreted protein n=1 Tax=Flagellimonas alvinocaridis TaxID=2530200 RepID=A0A4S8RW14_9FLAO|nr:membrane or secreted protein [Allomuricauda alvinocaridis]THV61445.1 membrane or secreted protein [Allomuricauda alvinocaridis]
MKKYILTLILVSVTLSMSNAQDLNGAWEATLNNDEGVAVQYVTIVSDGFFSEAFFEKENGKFIGTKGGSFSSDNGMLTYTLEFASFDSDMVGSTNSFPYSFKDGKLHVGEKIWSRVDDGTPGDLQGAWLISGRKQDGEVIKRDISGPRKTMKILSGTRFQWIAYNIETKAFMGTGGGTYTTANGKYTEHIGFFSRDDSRVGASLEFNFELKDGDWHHSGFSSKGQPIYEVWSIRKG